MAMLAEALLSLSLLLLVEQVTSNQGFVSDSFENTKFSCSKTKKKVYTAQSEVQCVQRCLRRETCDTINYKYGGDTESNCEVFPRGTCCTTVASNGWRGIVFELHKSKNHVTKPTVYKSCKDAYEKSSSPQDGVYELEQGPHFCNMSGISGCGAGGGWTLAMKIDGSKDTFKTHSIFWTSHVEHNTDQGMTSFWDHEAKFPAFNYISFDEICVGMRTSSSTNWHRVHIKRSSLLEMFLPSISISHNCQTSTGRPKWLSMVKHSALHQYCNREGFNVRLDDSSNTLVIRFGIISNYENNCRRYDSYTGLGGIAVSCGNFYHPVAGSVTVSPAICYLLIK